MPFELGGELNDPSGPIGQDRAVEAVQFAAQMRRKGYDTYALEPSGAGKHIALMMGELRAGYRDLPEVMQYLDAVECDIKENADDFLACDVFVIR